MACMPKHDGHLHEQDKDTHGEMFLTGRLQEIPNHPHDEFERTTLAAGAVLWRGDLNAPESVEVACIHRPHYDDWSLAKGKVDPDESLIQTAVREIKEETGYDVRLGKLLGKTVYPVKKTTKVVYYWTGEVTGGEFTPNNEVDEIRWLPIDTHIHAKKGSVWVLSFRDGQLTGADYVPSALPVL